MNDKVVLLIGASGLIGKNLYNFLKDHKYKQIQINRKSLGHKSDLTKEIVSDLDSKAILANIPSCDHVCIATGTRLSLMQLLYIRKKDRLNFLEVDLKMPVGLAKAAFDKGATEISIVSAVGANQNSKNFYLKVKGMLEREILNIGFDKVIIARPGHLLGTRDYKIAWEIKVYETISYFMAPMMVGFLKKFRNINAVNVASSIVSLINKDFCGSHILEYSDIMRQD